MTIKIRAFENGKEKIIPIDKILERETRARLVVDIDTNLLTAREVELIHSPVNLTENVYVNGQLLAEGSNYDYTISGKKIIFNVGILPRKGHILINYKYLT